ncbi:MAG: hypothetical protein ACKN9W_11435 [Methylococcus sp.]
MAHPDRFKPLFNRRLLREAVNQHPILLDDEQRKLALNWAASVQTLERELSAIVNRCYGLTDAEIDLLWRTAPPRMPNTA